MLEKKKFPKNVFLAKYLHINIEMKENFKNIAIDIYDRNQSPNRT